jgi:Protein of unknown function (DUF1353)/Bacterial SH3 domain
MNLSIGSYGICALTCSTMIMAGSAASGQFFGELVLKPERDGIHMTTVRPFGYVDDTGKRWETKAGLKTDGASIPRVLWSVIGSPFTGKYLPAAVIHDQFCESKYRSWEATHNVFYEAMMASGVNRTQGLIMWAAVYRFGPRWTKDESVCWNICAGGNVFLESVKIEPELSEAAMSRIKTFAASRDNISRSEMQRFIDDDMIAEWNRTGHAPKAKLTGFLSDDDGDGHRQYMEIVAPSNWPRFGNTNILNYTYDVVRVAKNDTLMMRNGPARKFPVIGKIPPDGHGITFSERCTTMWCKVRYNGNEGWVDASFLAVHYDQSNRVPGR